MNSVPPTDLIVELHQLLDAFLVGMILLSILEAHRVQYQMAVDMFTVDMSCHHNFIFSEGFLCKLHRYLVCELGLNFVTAGEALHQMIVEPPISFVVKILSCSHFIESSLG